LDGKFANQNGHFSDIPTCRDGATDLTNRDRDSPRRLALVADRALEAYRSAFKAEPLHVATAPGRVNLIGEHTDYNDGFVLPCAIGRRVAAAVGPGSGQLYSDDFAGARELSGAKDGSWADYPRGVAWAIRQAGFELPPWNAAFAGDVPIGSGLSSSAAIEAAAAVALNAYGGLHISLKDLAVLCSRAENGYIGVNSGIMDQYASLLCQPGSALLIDCRALEAIAVPLDLAQAGLGILVCDTRVKRSLAATEYNQRRAECEAAARSLGLTSLRDAGAADLERLEGDELKRARHVITENDRVLDAVAGLARDDFERFGELMLASHASLRDDFEVSVAELDTAVEAAMEAGALGARLTGAGFGGCAVALAPLETTQVVAEAVRGKFQCSGYHEPLFYTFAPEAGAKVVL
jgi:galactokinase